MYAILISKVQNKPCSHFCFKNLFNDNDTDCPTIYMLPRLATYNTYMRSLQYKLLNNVLFLNKKRLHHVPSVIYATKHLYTYFMNVVVLNAYGRI